METAGRIIDLSVSGGEREAWDRPTWVIYLWPLVEWLLVTNALQPSSGVRTRVLRAFGAQIGTKVIIRPRCRVKHPWKLRIGDRSWIGEGVWIHNQTHVSIGEDAVVSQETFITTGTHAFRTDMSLVMRPVVVEDGAWITSRCIVLAGSRVGRSALVLPGTTVRGAVPSGSVFGSPPAAVVGERFAADGPT